MSEERDDQEEAKFQAAAVLVSAAIFSLKPGDAIYLLAKALAGVFALVLKEGATEEAIIDEFREWIGPAVTQAREQFAQMDRARTTNWN